MTTEGQSDTNENWTLHVKQLSGQQFDVDLNPASSVNRLKTIISDTQDIPTNLQRLIFAGRELIENDWHVQEYGIKNGSTLHIVVRREPAPQDFAVQVADAGGIQANNGIRGFYPNGVIIHNQNPNVIAPAQYELLRLSRFIRLFAFIDGIFMFILGVMYRFPYSWPFYIGVLFAIAGYLGGKYLNRWLLIAFSIFLVGEICFRVYTGVVNPNPVEIIILTIMIFIHLYILRCVFRLWKAIPNLSDAERQTILDFNRQRWL